MEQKDIERFRFATAREILGIFVKIAPVGDNTLAAHKAVGYTDALINVLLHTDSPDIEQIEREKERARYEKRQNEWKEALEKDTKHPLSDGYAFFRITKYNGSSGNIVVGRIYKGYTSPRRGVVGLIIFNGNISQKTGQKYKSSLSSQFTDWEIVSEEEYIRQITKT